MKGILLFTEVANYLKTKKVQFDGSTLNLGGSIKEFSEVEGMLKQEKEEFEVSFLLVLVHDFDIYLFDVSYIHSVCSKESFNSPHI